MEFILDWLWDLSPKRNMIEEPIYELAKRRERMTNLKMVKSLYRGLLFIVLLALLMLCTILFITFLADPARMVETIKGTFGIH